MIDPSAASAASGGRCEGSCYSRPERQVWAEPSGTSAEGGMGFRDRYLSTPAYAYASAIMIRVLRQGPKGFRGNRVGTSRLSPNRRKIIRPTVICGANRVAPKAETRHSRHREEIDRPDYQQLDIFKLAAIGRFLIKENCRHQCL